MSIRPSIRHRKYIYAINFLLWGSGALFLTNRYLNNALFNSLVPRTSWEFILIQFHAAISFVSLVLIGSLISHFSSGLKTKKNLLTGITMILFFIILTITAWGLYYFSDDFLRENSIYIHSFVGLLFPCLLIGHILKSTR